MLTTSWWTPSIQSLYSYYTNTKPKHRPLMVDQTIRGVTCICAIFLTKMSWYYVLKCRFWRSKKDHIAYSPVSRKPVCVVLGFSRKVVKNKKLDRHGCILKIHCGDLGAQLWPTPQVSMTLLCRRLVILSKYKSVKSNPIEMDVIDVTNTIQK